MSTFIGKVIRILDEFTLIVNAGDSSVSVGDTVQIYEISEQIIDLDGNSLGDYVFIKDELEVIQVENNYCICKKDKTISKATSKSLALALSPLLEHSYIEKVPLSVDSSDFKPLPCLNKSIHLGDYVRKI